jgi:hypothetical protein
MIVLSDAGPCNKHSNCSSDCACEVGRQKPTVFFILSMRLCFKGQARTLQIEHDFAIAKRATLFECVEQIIPRDIVFLRPLRSESMRAIASVTAPVAIHKVNQPIDGLFIEAARPVAQPEPPTWSEAVVFSVRQSAQISV